MLENETAAVGYSLSEEPYYLPLADEVQIFQAAYEQRLPVLLKDQQAAAKHDLSEYMAHKLYGSGGGLNGLCRQSLAMRRSVGNRSCRSISA